MVKFGKVLKEVSVSALPECYTKFRIKANKQTRMKKGKIIKKEEGRGHTNIGEFGPLKSNIRKQVHKSICNTDFDYTSRSLV